MFTSSISFGKLDVLSACVRRNLRLFLGECLATALKCSMRDLSDILFKYLFINLH